MNQSLKNHIFAMLVLVSAAIAPVCGPPCNASLLTAGRDEPWGVELLTNGGFENGLEGWQIIAGDPVVIDTVYSVNPYEGQYFLYGGLNVNSWIFTLRQELDLVALGFTPNSLDSGAVVIIDSWLRNWNAISAWDDQVYLDVTFLSADGRLANCQTLFGGADSWVQRPLTSLLPTGTRTLRLDIVGLWRKDNDNDSFADAIRLSLVQALPDSPTITKLPMLQGYRADHLAVVWETDSSRCHHALEWGRESTAEHIVTDVTTREIDAGHFMHRAELTGLEPDVTYRYLVRSGSATSQVFEFTTLPRPGSLDCRIAWIADTQSNPATLTQHVGHIAAFEPDILVTVGDLLGDGSQLGLWNPEWWSPMSTSNLGQTVPQAVAFGNHEGEHPLTYAHIWLPGNGQSVPGCGAWHAFTVGPVFIVLLDTNTGNDREVPDQTVWLEQQLSGPAAQQALFRVVAFHMPPYSNLWYCGTEWVVDEWVDLFQQYQVDLVLSGHTHDYERGTIDGVTYCIIGGGGGALEDPEDWACDWEFDIVTCVHHFVVMDVAAGVLQWRVYDLALQLVDQFDIDRSPPTTATPTVTETPDPSATPSPATTATATPTPPPQTSSTPTPSMTPTPIHPDTPTPTATPSPTEQHVWLYLRLTKEQPLGCYRPGDEFILSVDTYNPGVELAANLYCALTFGSSYFFYPGWTQQPQSAPNIIPTGWRSQDLLRFDWPTGAGAAADLGFISVLTAPTTFDLISSISTAAFCYEE